MELLDFIFSNVPTLHCSACSRNLKFGFAYDACSVCSETCCHRCIRRRDGRNLCYRCLVFGSFRISRNALMQLSVRDLKWYLKRRNISFIATAKEALVDFILQYLGIRPTHRTNPTNSSSRQSTHQTSSSSVNMNRNTSSSTIPNTYRVELEKITHESDISKLSVRQLKYLLTHNSVDFKSCLEKKDLVDQAIRLWRNHQLETRNTEESYRSVLKNEFKEMDGTNTHEVPASYSFKNTEDCNICMESPINCVILECGHMVSCINCGHKLTECPVCRGPVARVVRTFRV